MTQKENNSKLTAGAPLLRQLTNCATRDRPLRLLSRGRDFFPLFAEEGLAEGDAYILKGLCVLLFLRLSRWHGLRIILQEEQTPKPGQNVKNKKQKITPTNGSDFLF